MITIRPAAKEDMSAVLELICELAAYEKAPLEVEVDVATLEADGFGPEKIFDCVVADDNSEIAGFALYYTKYSTWKGKCLFLEDFVVKESRRGQGIGKLLFDEVVAEARRRHVKRMEWQVLEWNTPAINFYNKYKANLDPEWLNGKLVYSQLQGEL
ncbi:MAG: GNAT family N-acetyltransferase [Bacteroidota bacterium]